ncbi:MAG: hypothetical protein KatS3mg115_2500 [Candidatus Poribacteria bacterium]|nr:MAG: hypothetical protein KatS3mg115_2500 [Candidatus Poribacteria bacterium]
MTNQPKPAREETASWRAVLLGWLLAALLGFGTVYNLMVVHGSYMAIDFSAAAAVFLFFLLVLANGAVGTLQARWALRAADLKVVYTMLLVACALPTMGAVAQLLPIITAPFYFATPENGWAEIIQPHIPRWLVPDEPTAIRQFYEGTDSWSVPWGVWLRPLLWWGLLLMAFYLASIGLMVLLRRQWMEHERLVYPLAQLPIELSEGPPERPFPAILGRSTLWIGFTVAFLNGSLIGLNHYFPVVPYLKPQLAAVPVFKNTEWLRFRISFPMLGFFYLVHLDVAFSMWFFNLLSLAVRGLMKLYQVRFTENLGIYGAPSPVFAHAGFGALAVLVLAGFWNARFHLRRTLRRALGRSTELDDRGEVLSYRAAWLLTVGGLTTMAFWLIASGLPPWGTTVFLAAALVIFLGLTRIVAESGMAEAVASTIPSSYLVSAFGANRLGPPGLVALGLTYVWSADLRTFVMASMANGLKVVEPIRRKRIVFPAVVGTILLTLTVSIGTMLLLAYRYGGINGNAWFFGGGAVAPYNYVANKILHLEGPNPWGWFFQGIGAGLMALLMYLRARFVGFPLHPVGFAIGPVWIMDHIWLTVFLAWALKWTFLRWGGVRLYRQMRPFFLGLILGQFVCNGTWILIDIVTGTKGNQIFWI